jgi:hypothetical protein
MFSTSTATTLFSGALTDLGGLLTTVIGGVLVIVVALLGLGMAIRYLRKYITGRKF